MHEISDPMELQQHTVASVAVVVVGSWVGREEEEN